MNDLGQVTGDIYVDGGIHPFLYTPGAGLADLGTLGGQIATGDAINNTGQVAGFSYLSDNITGRAFVYTPGAGLVDIGSRAGYNYIRALGIDNRGQVTGEVSPQNASLSMAFTYTPGAGITRLGTLGGPTSAGFAINNSGQVTGYSDFSDAASDVFLYTPGTGVADLGIPGISYSINDAGQIAVTYGNAGFLYTPGLSLLPIPYATGAFSVNEAGAVVGAGYLDHGNTHALLYVNGQSVDLNSQIDSSLGIELDKAVGINNVGQIVADGYGQAYLLTPVPEPNSAILSIAVLATLTGIRMARKRDLMSRPG